MASASGGPLSRDRMDSGQLDGRRNVHRDRGVDLVVAQTDSFCRRRRGPFPGDRSARWNHRARIFTPTTWAAWCVPCSIGMWITAETAREHAPEPAISHSDSSLYGRHRRARFAPVWRSRVSRDTSQCTCCTPCCSAGIRKVFARTLCASTRPAIATICRRPMIFRCPTSSRSIFRVFSFRRFTPFVSQWRRAAIAVAMSSAPAPFNVLDLDDDDHSRSELLLAIKEQESESARTHLERAALPRLRMLERVLLPRFQTLCMAAESDCERLRARCPSVPVVHLPNAVFPPAALIPTPASRRPTLLFVGTLDYLPNADAVDHFFTRILPLLREKFSSVRVLVVGANPTPKILNLHNPPDVEVFGNVPDVAPYYADCDAVIVPLRAGSGTRIKILEAFGFGKPVVSTSAGAEGLAVADGEQILCADDPAAFADACLRVLEDAALRARLASSAAAWLRANHSIESVDAVLRGIYAKILARALCPLCSERTGRDLRALRRRRPSLSSWRRAPTTAPAALAATRFTFSSKRPRLLKLPGGPRPKIRCPSQPDRSGYRRRGLRY